MRHVSGAITAATTRAYELVAAGEIGQARSVLGDALAGVPVALLEPDLAPDEVVAAAAQYAHVLLPLDPAAARPWADLAYYATRRRGPGDSRHLRSAATLAAVLHRLGRPGAAADLYRDLVGQLSIVDG